MTDLALAVENRDVEPGMVGAEAGRPQDCPYPAPSQVHAERRCRLDLGRREAVWRRHLVIKAGEAGPFVDALEKAGELQIGEGTLVAERAGELGLALGDAGKPSDQLDPDL